ncbi:PIN domain-containing protein [Nitratiruptor sp. YY09-18]|uniref:PIN domain-containing protein n=1 Tax=Nitratiruptor sp. YY09-18 TaxID=2724901 RepID=UPI001915E7E7|nr:PIN domain-containing protein [Nitratiruptor sp. YY09-18]
MKIKVMVDTNVLIYTFLDIDMPQKQNIKELFEASNRFQYVTTTRIIDEVIFKLVIISSGKKLKQLKKDRELLEKQTSIITMIKNFLKDFNFKVYEIKEKHYWKMIDIIKEYGLLGNDALTMAIMKENNLKYVATFDNDFADTYVENVLIYE